MNKETRIPNASRERGTLSVQLKRLHKRIKKSLSFLSDQVAGIADADDEARKSKVLSISTELFDLAEILQDLILVVDSVVGDDLVDVDDEFTLGEIDLVEVITALAGKFELQLKNLHKTFYNKALDKDLKLIAVDDFNKAWRSLEKNLEKSVIYLQEIIAEVDQA